MFKVYFLLFSQVAFSLVTCVTVSRWVVSDSLWPHGLYLTRLLCPWDSPGQNTGWGCHLLLQGISPTWGLNSDFLHCRNFFTIWATANPTGKTSPFFSMHQFFCDVFFCLHRTACRISVPWLGIQPGPLAEKVLSPNDRTTQESPVFCVLRVFSTFCQPKEFFFSW